MTVILHGIPLSAEVRAQDDLAALVADAVVGAGQELRTGDIVVVSSKVLSKARGLTRPSAQRDAAVRDATVRVVAERLTPGGTTQVVESVAGPVMAAGGVDASNTGGDEVLSLPPDPDACASELLADLTALWHTRYGVSLDLGVVVTDTAGRPWRDGQVDLAIGAAGVRVLEDLAGQLDDDGRILAVTRRALADELAAAADLVKGKTNRTPVAIVRGLPHLVGRAGPGARSLVRTGAADWFAFGSAEAVRAALGCLPGTTTATDVGIQSVIPESLLVRTSRAARLAGSPPGELRMTSDAQQLRLSLECGDTSYRAGLAAGRWLARLEVALASERLVADGSRHVGPSVHEVIVSDGDLRTTTLTP